MPLGSLVSGIIGAGGASAARAFANQAGQNTGAQVLDESYDVGNRDVGRLSPYIATGFGAENQLSQLYGLGSLSPIGDKWGTFGTTPDTNGQMQKNALANFQTSPGYQFRLQQGVNALDRSASAKGMNLSGAQSQALSDYGQNTGSQEFGNYVGQLNALASGGQSAAGAAGSLYNDALVHGINTQSGDMMAGAMENARGIQNSSNALASGIGNAINGLGSLASFGLGGGFSGLGLGLGGSGAVTAGAAPAGGYGGYAGYANSLPGFSQPMGSV